MRYHRDYPLQLRAAVAAEKVRAGRDYDRARENPDPSARHWDRPLEQELRKYILRQFVVFVAGACELGKKGVWSVDHIEERTMEFLRLATIEAVFDKGHDKWGKQFGRDWTGHLGALRQETMRQFEKTAEWTQFQDALLRVAEARRGHRLRSTPNRSDDVAIVRRSVIGWRVKE